MAARVAKAARMVILDGDHPVEEIAQRFYQEPFFLFLGRHIGLPVALEGALKLKEISYIPTEAYSAGEMKHGPIALLDEGTPVVVVATNIHVYDKIVSNIQETRARGAHVIAIATEGNEDIQHHADDVIYADELGEDAVPARRMRKERRMTHRTAVSIRRGIRHGLTYVEILVIVLILTVISTPWGGSGERHATDTGALATSLFAD